MYKCMKYINKDTCTIADLDLHVYKHVLMDGRPNLFQSFL